MAKLLSTKYSAGAFNAAMLFLRLSMGIIDDEDMVMIN